MSISFMSNNKIMSCLSLLLLISLLTIGCKDQVANEEYLNLEEELKANYRKSIPENVNYLIFITDKGCPNCIISFSQLILQSIDKYKGLSLVFINSSGRNVDIDSYSSINDKNIIISSDYPDNLKLIPSLGIVYLNPQKQKIDTIIHIDAFKINEQFQYIIQKR